MRNIMLAFFFISFGCISLRGQSTYRFNDTLYVWSMKGVPIFKEADNPDTRIRAYYYGQSARVVDTKMGKYKIKEEIGKDFQVRGAMVKVIMGKDTGYVFDGFLSPLRPLDPASGERGVDLVKASYGEVPVVSKNTRSSDGQGGTKSYMNFGKDIHYEKKRAGNCEVESYFLEEISLNGAYYFMMTVYANYFVEDAEAIVEPEFSQEVHGKYHFTLDNGTEKRRITIQKADETYEISTFQCDLQ